MLRHASHIDIDNVIPGAHVVAVRLALVVVSARGACARVFLSELRLQLQRRRAVPCSVQVDARAPDEMASFVTAIVDRVITFVAVPVGELAVARHVVDAVDASAVHAIILEFRGQAVVDVVAAVGPVKARLARAAVGRVGAKLVGARDRVVSIARLLIARALARASVASSRLGERDGLATCLVSDARAVRLGRGRDANGTARAPRSGCVFCVVCVEGDGGGGLGGEIMGGVFFLPSEGWRCGAHQNQQHRTNNKTTHRDTRAPSSRQSCSNPP